MDYDAECREMGAVVRAAERSNHVMLHQPVPFDKLKTSYVRARSAKPHGPLAV